MIFGRRSPFLRRICSAVCRVSRRRTRWPDRRDRRAAPIKRNSTTAAASSALSTRSTTMTFSPRCSAKPSNSSATPRHDTARGPFSLTINHESRPARAGIRPASCRAHQPCAAPLCRCVEALGYRKAKDLVAYLCRVAELGLVLAGREVVDGARRARSTITALLAELEVAISPGVGALQRCLVRQRLGDAGRPEEARLISPHGAAGVQAEMGPHRRLPGEDVAVAREIPDANEALRGLEGKLAPFGSAKLIWRLHGRGVKRSRAPMTGIAKKWRNTRVAAHALSGLVATRSSTLAKPASRRSNIAGCWRRMRRRSTASATFPHGTPAHSGSTRKRSEARFLQFVRSG